jgi:hypothetical protein
MLSLGALASFSNIPTSNNVTASHVAFADDKAGNSMTHRTRRARTRSSRQLLIAGSVSRILSSDFLSSEGDLGIVIEELKSSKHVDYFGSLSTLPLEVIFLVLGNLDGMFCSMVRAGGGKPWASSRCNLKQRTALANTVTSAPFSLHGLRFPSPLHFTFPRFRRLAREDVAMQ